MQTTRLWFYGLSAPMVALNREWDSSYSASTFFIGEHSVDLKESWDLDNRQDLLALIYQMTDHGHAEHLDEGYFFCTRLSNTDWRNYLEKFDERQQAFLEFVSQTSSLCGEGGIRAWDFGRMSFLIRVGVGNNWLTEPESDWLHYVLSLRARDYYTNWRSYCNAFVIGRCYWQSLGETSAERLRASLSYYANPWSSNRYIMQHLYADRESPINSLDWLEPLIQPLRPDSLD